MIDFSQFENPFENIFILKKWDWDYLEAGKLQLECVEYVRNNPHIVFLMVCSHPHCFTLGRGLQKIKESDVTLVDFDPATTLPFPIHSIKRGGGLTFHYPGQLVFYPIINLTQHKKAVFDLMMSIMIIVKKLLEDKFDLPGLVIRRDLLGLWFENEFSKAKIASIGLAVSRFNTYHGLALNFFKDQEMFQALKQIHPCGLPGDIYRDLETLTCSQIPLIEREKFAQDFLAEFITSNFPNHLMMDKQRSSSFISSSI